MKVVILLTSLAMVLAGCSPKNVSLEQARALADGRFKAHAAALGLNAATVPVPTIEERQDDYVFVYRESTSQKKVTVIVTRAGELADTVE